MTIIERVLLFEGVDLFSEVTTEQLSFLAAIAEEREFDPGKIVYREGDPPDGLYAVISGEVEMRRSGEPIDTIGADGVFGVWALFDDEPRLTTAQAVEECQVLFVSRDAFYELLSDHVEIVEGLFKHLVRRLRRLTATVERSLA
jgi:CRP/FNR family cyclic AMP-dependent transcriptional regulator